MTDQALHRWGGAIRFDASRTVRHDNGWIDLDGVATGAGVSDYVDARGGVVRELKHPEDLFDDEAIASLVGVPVTNEHPAKPLDANNTRHFARGSVLEARRDGDLLRVRVRITDGGLADDVQSGKVQLSPGFSARVVESSGVYNGERYDARQTGIRHNHLAVVDRARFGPEARLRLDSARIEREDQAVEPETVVIAGIEYQVPAAVAQTLVGLEAQVAELAAQVEAMTPAEEPAEEMPAEEMPAEGEPVVEDATEKAPIVISATPRADGADSKDDDRYSEIVARLDHLEATSNANARARGLLERQAARVLPLAFKYDEADDAAIMAAAIVAVTPNLERAVDAHRTDAAYLRPLFDLAIAEHATRSDSSSDLAAAVGKARQDSGRDKITDARQRYLDRITGKTTAQA